jgi:hypothetical protein
VAVVVAVVLDGVELPLAVVALAQVVEPVERLCFLRKVRL